MKFRKKSPNDSTENRGRAGPNFEANKSEGSFSPKAARYSVIVPTVCWIFVVEAGVLNWNFYGIAWVFVILLLFAFSSLCAGFMALRAPKKLDVFAGVLGILQSVSFGFYDLLGLTIRV